MVTYIGILIIIILFIKKLRDKPSYRYKGEGMLYELIKKDYRDSVYQYRSKWLGLQSYDIYIPSKKIGIEYQGEQHFSSIKYFGGKEKYKEQRKLDKEKIRKSKENGVTLLYFTFNKKMPNRLLNKKVYKDYKKLKRRIRYNWIYNIFKI